METALLGRSALPLLLVWTMEMLDKRDTERSVESVERAAVATTNVVCRFRLKTAHRFRVSARRGVPAHGTHHVTSPGDGRWVLGIQHSGTMVHISAPGSCPKHPTIKHSFVQFPNALWTITALPHRCVQRFLWRQMDRPQGTGRGQRLFCPVWGLPCRNGEGDELPVAHLLTSQNLATRALELRKCPDLGYEQSFLHHLRIAAPAIKQTRPKILTNAGALNPRGLAEKVARLLRDEGLSDLKVAYVEGDNIIDRLDELRAAGEDLHHLEDSSRRLDSWPLKPASANAYVGARGIVAALRAGADIVISGRCTDASPVIGAAAWWYNWSWDNYDALAGALLAGHCIECGAYVTGGNSSGFKGIKDYYNFSMGIAEIEANGTFVITKREYTPKGGLRLTSPQSPTSTAWSTRLPSGRRFCTRSRATSISTPMSRPSSTTSRSPVWTRTGSL